MTLHLKASMTKLQLALLLLMAEPGLGQAGLIKRADRHFDNFNFLKASELYKKAWSKDPNLLEAKAGLADCYRLMNEIDQAELYYSYVVEDSASDPESEWHYAQSLRSNQKYDKAKEAYEAYADKAPEDTRASVIANEMHLIEKLAQTDKSVEISLLDINSKSSEFSPAFYKDGIVFASNRNKSAFIKWLDLRTQNNFLDLYTAQPDENGTLGEPELFKGRQPNRRYHEGPVAFNQNETAVYITRSNYEMNKEQRSETEAVHLKIYKLDTDVNNDNLDNLTEAVPFNSNEYSVGHPALTADNRHMYFMSNMPGGYGGTDLYVSKRQGNTWGDPENLGPEINTAGNEMFPFVDEDGILYFASDGGVGLGGLDVYQTRQVDGKWSAVQNLGAPINSSSDDFGLIYDPAKKEGYFTSNRQGGIGDDDIYQFKRNAILVRGIAYDATSGESLEGVRVVLNQEMAEQITDAEGAFSFLVEPNSTYQFETMLSDYFPGKLDIDVIDEPVFVKIPVQKNEGITIDILAQDKKSKKKLENATIVLRNATTGEEQTCKTGNNGTCTFELDENATYEVIGWKDLVNNDQRFLKVNKPISTVGKSSGAKLNVELELEFVERGVAIKIENIYYDLDQHFIRPDAAVELDKIVKILKDNPGMEIELSSHTDSQGSDVYNKQLSENRAESVVAYITSRGIEASRMAAVGYGEARLVNRCSNGTPCSSEEHQQNRRTEFKILKF